MSARKASKTTRTPGRKAAPSRAAAKPAPLSLSDLEVPVRPLLTHPQELRSGRKIRLSLSRLAQLLPRHPLGYRRFLARMGEVSGGGALMFSWLSLRERMAADFETARKALDKAEELATQASRARVKRRRTELERKSRTAFERGVKILQTYPLDPETTYQWSREVARSRRSAGPLAESPRTQKVVRLLGKVVDVLELERDAMVLPNFRLVLKEVFRYHPHGMWRSDLFQEGILGLHKAVFRFDASRNIRFSTYATYWIRQSIRKSLIDKSRLIRVPQAIQEEMRKDTPKMKPTEVDRVRRLMSETVLFSAGDSDDSDDRFSFEVKDTSQPEIAQDLHTRTVPRTVVQALNRLNTRERDVVQRRFGLGGGRPQTLEEIGSLMNLSRERIRQIEREALDRLSHYQELLEVYEDLDLVGSAGAARS
jgi:RNA polymerase primary sigma factor